VTERRCPAFLITRNGGIDEKQEETAGKPQKVLQWPGYGFTELPWLYRSYILQCDIINET
jgi:hypothetical protein